MLARLVVAAIVAAVVAIIIVAIFWAKASYCDESKEKKKKFLIKDQTFDLLTNEDLRCWIAQYYTKEYSFHGQW